MKMKTHLDLVKWLVMVEGIVSGEDVDCRR